jgi:hypothetical protein
VCCVCVKYVSVMCVYCVCVWGVYVRVMCVCLLYVFVCVYSVPMSTTTSSDTLKQVTYCGMQQTGYSASLYTGFDQGFFSVIMSYSFTEHMYF